MSRGSEKCPRPALTLETSHGHLSSIINWCPLAPEPLPSGAGLERGRPFRGGAHVFLGAKNRGKRVDSSAGSPAPGLRARGRSQCLLSPPLGGRVRERWQPPRAGEALAFQTSSSQPRLDSANSPVMSCFSTLQKMAFQPGTSQSLVQTASRSGSSWECLKPACIGRATRSGAGP